MKTHVIVPMILFLLVIGVSQSFAQDSLPEKVLKTFRVGIEAGVAANSLVGDAKTGVNQLIQVYQFPVDERMQVRGDLAYTFSPVLGAYIHYSTGKRLNASAGLRFQSRGYSLSVNGEERDPEFQYDERFRYREEYSGINLEIPISASYNFSRRLALRAGPVLGVSLGNAPTVSMRMKEEIIVNGEVSPLSAGLSENEIELTDENTRSYFGLMTALDYRVRTRLAISASYFLVSEYRHIMGLGNLSDQSLSLTLKYDLFDF